MIPEKSVIRTFSANRTQFLNSNNAPQLTIVMMIRNTKNALSFQVYDDLLKRKKAVLANVRIY